METAVALDENVILTARWLIALMPLVEIMTIQSQMREPTYIQHRIGHCAKVRIFVLVMNIAAYRNDIGLVKMLGSHFCYTAADRDFSSIYLMASFFGEAQNIMPERFPLKLFILHFIVILLIGSAASSRDELSSFSLNLVVICFSPGIVLVIGLAFITTIFQCALFRSKVK
jgi:hypothetical protein